MPTLTAGLKRPPLILKKVQTLTARLIPKDKAIKTSLDGLDARLSDCPSTARGAELTVLVPPNAKSKNMNVPANSLRAATRSIAS